MPTMSPSDSGASVTRCPLTKVPLELSRSTMRYPPATLRSSAWCQDTGEGAMTMSLSGARPMRSVVVGGGRFTPGSPAGGTGSGRMGGTGGAAAPPPAAGPMSTRVGGRPGAPGPASPTVQFRAGPSAG
jgi:hypothetical protein